MAYTDKPQDFFARLQELGAAHKLPERLGVVSFVIEGESGGTWWVDFTSGDVSTEERPASLTLKARDRDFMALLEGRMSSSDGLLTDRLVVSGDAGQAFKLSAFLRSLSQPPEA